MWTRVAPIVAILSAVALVAAVVVGLPGGREPSDQARAVDTETSRDPDVVVGAEPADARSIGGSVGQDIGATFPLSQNGPADPTVVANSLWWTWVAPRSETVRFSTVGSEVDTAMTIRQGDPGGSIVASGTDAGDIAAAEATVDAVAGETYFIEVASETGPSAGLVVLSWQPSAAVEVDAEEPPAAFTSPEVPLIGTTGEKPQSKLWNAQGTWWAVLASASTSPAGTWVWRYDGGMWAAVAQVSERTDVRADVLQAGAVVHVLLHGPVSSLVSLEYDAGSRSYIPWGSRGTPTVVSLPGSETATIDVDGTGRLWLATETSSEIQMRWADAPYSAFSAPITVASGITEDDIAVVTALPGAIGVLWSNQATKRFGFRTHVDGTAPTAWTADESPASASARNVGAGMADDHLNVALASDGTLYAAVKTSYDTANEAVIALLVRRPGGTWDPLRQVDTRGTRPIVLIDEATETLRVIYTATEIPDDILEKTTTLAALDFSDAADVVVAGSFNNVTSAKTNVPGQALIMASGATTTATTALTWTNPDAPQANSSSVSTSVGSAVDGIFDIDADLPIDQLEIVTEPDSGTVTVSDVDRFTYDPAADFSGVDSFTFRVRSGALWSQVATVTVVVATEDGLLGEWSLDEGVGTTFRDASLWGNDGTLQGGASWVSGFEEGSALRFDGAAARAVIPHAASFEHLDQLTVSAWIKPEKIGTQYVFKKADGDLVDGFELSFASSGLPYFRLNHATSGNTYRLQAPQVPVADGSTWLHLAGTYDGTTMRLFLNGVEVSSMPGPDAIGVNSLPLMIGGQPGGENSFEGTVDDVRLYQRALSAADIAGVYSGDAEPTPAPEPTPTPTPTPTPGGVGFWGFDESSGLTAVDGSGSGNDGVISGGVQRGLGVVDGGLSFDGTTGRVTVADSASLDVTGALTVAAWVRPERAGTQGIVKKSANGSVSGYELSMASTGKAFFRLNQAASGDTFRVNAPAVAPMDGSTWVHLVGTYDGSVMRLYVNGVLTGTLPGPSSIATNGLPLVIGDQPGGGYPFAGGIDDARVLSRALSASEVSVLFTGETPAPEPTPTPTPEPTPTPTPEPEPAGTLPAGTVARWAYEEVDGTTASGGSGSGLAGVLSGGFSRVAGVSGQAVRLNGTDARVTVAASSSFNFGSGLTIATWIKPEKVATQGVLKKSANGSVNGYELSLAGNGKAFFRLNQASSGDGFRVNATSVYPVDGSTWVHVAATYDGSTIRIYVNGVLEGEGAGPSSILTNDLPLVLGDQANGGYGFQGAIDETYVAGRAFTAAEIGALASSGP